MPKLEIGVPVKSTEPILVVDNELPPGKHTFKLTVEDNAGTVSDGVTVTVTVLSKPIATLYASDVVYPNQVKLDASASQPVPPSTTLKRYYFTYLGMDETADDNQKEKG